MRSSDTCHTGCGFILNNDLPLRGIASTANPRDALADATGIVAETFRIDQFLEQIV